MARARSTGAHWQRIVVGLLGLSAILVGGCIGKVYSPMVAVPPSRGEVAAVVPPSFETPNRSSVELTRVRRAAGSEEYGAFDLRFASVGDNGQAGQQVEGRYFRLRRSGAHPLVIVLPIWGRSTIPPQLVRRRLQRFAGTSPMHVVTITGADYLFDWDRMAAAENGDDFLAQLGDTSRVLEVQIKDIRRLLTWATSREEIDPDRIALVGFSISAFLASTVMGVDRRVSGGVFVMGGGSLTDVFLYCHRDVARVRENLARRTGWDEITMRRKIDELLGPLSPVRYAGSIEPQRVLLVEAGRDECVPELSRRALWEAMGRPARITIDRGHRKSFYTMTFVSRHWTTKQIAQFLVGWAGRPADGDRSGRGATQSGLRRSWPAGIALP